MKKSVKKFFLLGLALGAAGYAAKHTNKIRKAVTDLVKKKKLPKEEAETLVMELIAEVEKKGSKKPVITKARVTKKRARNKK